MTRIVAGTLGGRRLEVPKSGTRPTSERVREALFARLDHYGVLRGARVLDLCAGSGALGLEAYSRGAAQVHLVDASKAATAVAQRNIRALGASGVRALTANAATYISGSAGAPVQVVFLDPPYDMAQEVLGQILAGLARREDPWLDDTSVVVVERSSRSGEPIWPQGMECFSQKNYGETTLWFAQRTEQE